MMVDMHDRVEIGPNVDGSYCFVAPDSEPIVTRGKEIPGKLDLWYLAVVGIGSRGQFYGIVGEYPVRSFMDKADAVALHNMILADQVKWNEAIEVPITDGWRGLIHKRKLLVGSNVPSIADLHKGRRLR